MGIDISVGASGGVSLGEGVELGVQGGLSVDTSLYKVTLEEHHGSIEDLYTAKGSANAFLRQLDIKAGGKQRTLMPQLNYTDTIYSVYVPNDATNVTIDVRPQSPGAKVTVDSNSIDPTVINWTQPYTIPLSTERHNYVEITVLSENGEVRRTYGVHVERAPSMKLMSLDLSYKADPAYQFDPDKTEYEVTIPLYIDSIGITPELEHGGATLKVNGVPWSNKQTFNTYLNVGDNIITFEVGDHTDTNTYTVNLRRAPSEDASLAYMKVNQGTLSPAFDTSTTSYTVNVNEDVNSIHFNALVNEPNAIATLYRVNGDQREELQSQPYGIEKTVELKAGLNKFEIVVTAQDKVTEKTYEINVYRPNAYLSRLVFRIGDGDDAEVVEFDPDVVGHSYNLTNDSNVYISAVPVSDTASVTYHIMQEYDGTPINIGTGWTQISELGMYAHSTVVVTVNDGSKAGSYAIMINGSEDDTSLWQLGYALNINDAATMFEVESDKFDYSVDIALDSDKIYITAAAPLGMMERSCVIINNHVDHSLSNICVPLGYGLNKIPITVLAPNGSIGTYILNVTRSLPMEKIAEFTSLTASLGTFDKPFDPQVTNYLLTIPTGDNYYPEYSTDVTISLSYAASMSTFNNSQEGTHANYQVDSSKNDSSKIYKIEVKFIKTFDPIPMKVTIFSPDRSESKTYNITVQLALPSNAYLRYLDGLEVSTDQSSIAQLTPGYNTSNYDYTLNVNNEVEKIYVRSRPWYPGASMTINGVTAEYQYTPRDSNSVQHYEWREIPLSVGTNEIKVTVTALDGISTKTYTVTVNRAAPPDLVPPTLWLPSNIKAEATSVNGAYVNFSAAAFDEADGEVPVQYSKEPGSLFPLGSTTVIVTARDKAGNIRIGSFVVTVQDTTSPVFGPVNDIEVYATDSEGAVVNFDVSATDLVDGPVTVSYSSEPGSVFPVGKSFVFCSAQDSSGNTAEQIFTVTVKFQNASISPETVSFDVYNPGDISTTISWGSATTVTGVVYNSAHSLSPGDYSVNENILTISESYLSGLNLVEGNSVDFEISFNAGKNAVLTINAVNSYVPSADAALKDLRVGGKTVTGFKSDEYEYTIQFPHGTKSRSPAAAVSATPNDSRARVNITQAANLPGTATVKVIAEDGTEITYTINFAVAEPSLSSDASLSGLTLSAGSLDFKPDTFNYTLHVPNHVSEITVTPVTKNENAKVTVNGKDVENSKEIELKVGSNYITIVVISQDDTNKRTYKVIVNRAEAPTISPATVSFALDNPGDVKTNITYWSSATTISDVVCSSIHLASPGDYSISGNILTINESFLSGLNLAEGDSTDFEITFDTGDSAVLTVNAVSNYIPSDDAALSDLRVGEATVTGFESNTYEYTFRLPHGTQPGSPATIVSATPNDPRATVSITQAASLPGTTMVVVTAENGFTLIYTINFTVSEPPLPSDDDDSGEVKDIQTPHLQSPTATVAGLKVTATVDTSTGTVKAELDANTVRKALDAAPAGSDGKKKLEVELPRSDTGSYNVELPAAVLSNQQPDVNIEIKTDAGTVTVPGNMLAGTGYENQGNAGLTIKNVDKSIFSEDVRDAIGDKPVIQLGLTVNGEPKSWNNPDAPVTVTIPYTPTAEELENPDNIVVWYIDGSGNIISVPNGRYDPVTGTVTFTTTHFSYYAVSYKQVSFKDVAKDAWYAKAVSFIAARDITNGTGNGNFSPEAKLTRAQFIVMMMRAFGIAPDENPKDNFADAGDTWYTGYLAAAKRLGISAGVGNNMFAPEREITRQEMFTLLYNTLRAIGQLPGEAGGQPGGNSVKTLSDFSDANDIAPWARKAIKILVEAGVISGSGNRLLPEDTATRAQMAQMLYNLLSK